ncbi:hypothetical protein [Nocardioides mesophilus]|uniref:Uncharacterized protein n=1 Tax=Nocardioides mesophilus TaxID=433659 RepID=A0A7G9RG18_9ACTN|nr:hypothetical protein [Nocardioides mesophilus]QNN54543.1 hypothetical protein H9L09_09665 [Nocardioides mesophilus]
MPRVDQQPAPRAGRRRAAPERRPRLSGPRLPAVRVARPRLPAALRSRHRLVPAWVALTAVAVLVLAGAALDPWVRSDLPGWLPRAAAVTITTAYAVALSARSGGRPLGAGALALALAGVAVVSGSPVLLAAATVSTAVLGAVLGVLLTVPAARFWWVVRECLVAVLVAAVAALAAPAYGAEVSVERTGYVVLGLALVGTLLVVYRLGAGFHGLGRRGAVVIVAGLLLLAVALAYTEALARWGSPELIATLEDGYDRVHDLLGAVPRPLEALLGLPALAWGVSTRARRRQGWWPCAFGAAGLAVVATALLDPRRSLGEAGLELGYGVGLGLLLGYLVIRGDAFLSGNRGVRARRAEEAAAHRPEPPRAAALL